VVAFTRSGGRVIRRYWRQSRFWVWWWRNRVSPEAKLATAAVLVIGLAAGGFLAAGGLSAAASDADGEVRQTRTVLRTTTIREQGTTTIREQGSDRRTVTIPGGAGVSTRTAATEIRLATVTIPGRAQVVRRQVVTTRGPVRTLTTTVRGHTGTRVVTAQRVVTSERVVTAERTTTRVVTERVPVTETVSSTNTVTLSPVTVTEQNIVTVTVTVPRP
jgi:hypothetical protein